VPTHTALARALRPLGRPADVLSWSLILIALPLSLTRSGVRASEAIPPVVVGVVILLYLTVVVRLLGTAAGDDAERSKLARLLLVAIVLRVGGSLLLRHSGHSTLAKELPLGGVLLAASAVTLFLLLRASTPTPRKILRGTKLQAAAICGGIASVNAALLWPAVLAHSGGGLEAIVVLLVPTLDGLLALLVVVQLAVRRRPRDARGVLIFLSLMILTISDAQQLIGLDDVNYRPLLSPLIAEAAAVGLLVAGVCGSSPRLRVVLMRRPGPQLLILASVAAILVMALRPTDGPETFLAIPAVLTLLAAGGRLGLALREANGAAEALVLSRTDDLTLLPNRRAVLLRLDEDLKAAVPLALMMLDLDGFKDVNDTLGHSAGDAVLKITALRVRDALPPGSLVARLGGDEFAVVVADEEEKSLLDMAALIAEVIQRPLVIDGIQLSTSASIGITLRAPTDSVSTDLLRRADVAMYQAKQARAGALLYDAQRDDFSRNKLRLSEELRRGIADGQIELWYQPQVDAATQTLCGVEALVRWRHPQQGLLAPYLFLPAARRTGLMLQLSERIGELAIEQSLAWRERGLNVRVAINCAPPELLSGVFLPRLFEAVERAALPPDSLVIEVTEDSFLAEPERAKTILREIRAHDIQIAIDDYGTGFSSLSYLRDLPVQELKMDRSFISSMRSDPRTRMIIASTFQMAQALGLRMVAEGVEDAATMADLVAMGVDVLQGYYLAKPMPASEIEGWIGRWKTLAARMDPIPAEGSSGSE
jgi:diguanylate cyclase (GGDEF)-like protein